MSKQFGLIIPGQQKKPAVQPQRAIARPTIFDESSNSSDSDNDAGAPKKRPTAKLGAVSGPSLMERRVARNVQEKALAEDPTIFQYDELYDEMENKREEAKESKRLEPRKAKYIGRLMEHAERRKLENELRIERKVQKDREAEGEMYKDKDTYVTTAYRKKLESIRTMQEQEERDEYLEAIGDVTKQKDLDGFYRHLYEQKLGTEKPVLKPKTAPSTEEVAYKPIMPDVSTTNKKRTYRRRQSSEDDEPTPEVQPAAATDGSKSATNSAKAHLPNNIDADSDFSIDSSDEEEQQPESKTKTDPKPPPTPKAIVKPAAATEKQKQKEKQSKSKTEPAAKEASPANEDQSEQTEVAKVVKPPVDRSHIWLKRTVGEVFDAALARYQERKLARRA